MGARIPSGIPTRCGNIAYPTIRKRLDEYPTIGFGVDTRIGHHDDPGIGGGSDQTPKSLSHFDDRFRQLIVAKRIPTSGSNRFEPGFQERVVRDTEWKLRDDDVVQRITGNVDTLPERVGSEEDATRLGLEGIQ